MSNDSWTNVDAANFYKIANWGDGYFDINPQGEVVVNIKGKNTKQLSLNEIAKKAKQFGLSMPLLLRFGDILQDRVNSIRQAFQKAKNKYNYAATYIPVYPIKVNQQRNVMEYLSEAPGGVGYEVGSKPELMVVMSVPPKGNLPIICNGYKDEEYVRLALISQAINKRTIIIVDKLNELDLIIKQANKLKITPRLGVRARLSSIGRGNWQNTGGEKSKFGLNSS